MMHINSLCAFDVPIKRRIPNYKHIRRVEQEGNKEGKNPKLLATFYKACKASKNLLKTKTYKNSYPHSHKYLQWFCWVN
jgi:hypothetical protein